MTAVEQGARIVDTGDELEHRAGQAAATEVGAEVAVGGEGDVGEALQHVRAAVVDDAVRPAPIASPVIPGPQRLPGRCVQCSSAGICDTVARVCSSRVMGIAAALSARIHAAAPIAWILFAACSPGPNGASTVTAGVDTGDPGATAGDSGPTTSDSGATMGGDTTGVAPITTSESGGSSTTCEPTPEDPVCSAIPVLPGGDRGCGGEELSIVGCDQLAGYEVCPNLAVHRHTAGIPCDDGAVCSPWFSCSTDEQCGPDQACICDVTGPYDRFTSCVPAECRTDADCAFGMRCGVNTLCGFITGLFCHTPEDGCEGDADCPELCRYSNDEKRWFCVGYIYCE